MKRILRHYVIDTFSLYAVTLVATGVVFEKGTHTLLLAGVGITTAMLLAKPIINILLLPLNLVTFGLFRWVSSAIALYLTTLVVPGLKIIGFHFSGLTSKWIDIPPLNFSGVLAYIAFSFLLSILISFIFWLIK